LICDPYANHIQRGQNPPPAPIPFVDLAALLAEEYGDDPDYETDDSSTDAFDNGSDDGNDGNDSHGDDSSTDAFDNGSDNGDDGDDSHSDGGDDGDGN
jgi:hypothetical protein